MLTWLRNKIAGPLLPILDQTYKVVSGIVSSIGDVKKTAIELGLTPESPIISTMDTVHGAALAVKAVLQRVIEFLGGTLPVTTSSADLNVEVDRLKKMLGQ